MLRLLIVPAMLVSTVMSQIYLPCNNVPAEGCSCFDPDDNIVTCQNLELTEFPDVTEVHTFDLSYNNLTSISADSLRYLVKLRRLYVHHNRISFIDRRSFQPVAKYLREIDLSDNRLTSIPVAFGTSTGSAPELTKLVMLDLSRNRIAYILNSDFKFVKKLKTLHLVGNPIWKIENNGWYLLRKLRTLSVSMNHDQFYITNMTQRFLDKLKSLKVTGAKPVSFPELSKWLEKFSRIEHLQLSEMHFNDRHFRMFPELQFPIRYKSKLKTLSLSGNNLTHVPPQIVSLHNLKRLDLSRNAIETLQKPPLNHAHSLPSSLHELDLQGNSLTNIDSSILLRLRDSQLIDLRNNQLQGITWSSVAIYNAFDSSMVLALGGNPWRCSCANRWLLTLAQRQVSHSNGHLRLEEVQTALFCSPDDASNTRVLVIKAADRFVC